MKASNPDWDKETRRMLYSGWEFVYGEMARKPQMDAGDGIRLYSKAELESILNERQMKIVGTFSDYYGKEASVKGLQLMVYSQKQF